MQNLRKLKAYQIIIGLEVIIACFGWINVFQAVGVILAITVSVSIYQILDIKNSSIPNAAGLSKWGYIFIIIFHSWLHQASFSIPLRIHPELPFGYSPNFWAWVTSIFFISLALLVYFLKNAVEAGDNDKKTEAESIKRMEDKDLRTHELELAKIQAEVRKQEAEEASRKAAIIANQRKAEAEARNSEAETKRKEAEARVRIAEAEAETKSRIAEAEAEVRKKEAEAETSIRIAEAETKRKEAEIAERKEEGRRKEAERIRNEQLKVAMMAEYKQKIADVKVKVQKAEPAKTEIESGKPSESESTAKKAEAFQRKIKEWKAEGKQFTVKELAKELGTSDRTLRNYKEKGFIQY